MTVNIDLTDYGSSHPVLTGQIVRHLDNGIILAQDTGWVWIPKDQVRRVTEVGGKRWPETSETVGTPKTAKTVKTAARMEFADFP